MTVIAVKERPILMHARSVRGILDGRKTQTRRIIKRPLKHPNWTGYMITHKRDGAIECGPDYPDDASDFVKCPYGKPGDRLWVRETFSLSGLTKFHSTGNPNDHGGPNDRCCAYAATGTYKCGKRIPNSALASGAHKWKPSIHMSRWASRLALEITDIRVERVQDISIADARAEGVPEHGSEAFSMGLIDDTRPFHEFDNRTSAENFGLVWDATNGKGAWDRNDWVWVISFRRLSRG